MSHRGDSFDPLASHKPVPPRPTRQEALEAVLVACDALEEAGDLATAMLVREAVEGARTVIGVDYGADGYESWVRARFDPNGTFTVLDSGRSRGPFKERP